MSDNKVNDLLGVSMDKIKQMVDVNTVVGDPITTPEGTTVIPISRVNYGFAAGGSDLPSKSQPSGGLFAGGSGYLTLWICSAHSLRKRTRLRLPQNVCLQCRRRKPQNNIAPVRIS